MITISRRLARRVVRVFRQALDVNSRRAACLPVMLETSDSGLAIRCLGGEVAIEYCQPGDFPAEQFVVPFKLFKEIEGGDDHPVTLKRVGHEVEAQWIDGGIPQMVRLDLLEMTGEFPAVPDGLSANEL